MAQRAFAKVRVVKVPSAPRIIKVGPAKKKKGRRRGGGGLLGGVGGGLREVAPPVIGAWIGAKVAGGATNIPLADMVGSKKIALGILFWGAGHLARIPILKKLAVGPLAAAAWEHAVTGQVSGDDDVEGDDIDGEDDE